MEKSGKIRSCHCTRMAGMDLSCNHVATAMYKIEVAVRNRLTYPSCTSTANQLFSNHKEVQPMKAKDMNFGREDFCVDTKEKYNPLSKQGIIKMLTLNDFTEDLRDVCHESILFSAVPKPDVDFVTDLVKQQTDEVTENLCSVCD